MKKFLIAMIATLLVIAALFLYIRQESSKKLDKMAPWLARAVLGTLSNFGMLPKDRFITQKEILVFANKEAARLGYDIESMDVYLDRYNAEWNKLISNNPSYLDCNPGLRDKLRSGYWAVYYSPKRSFRKGGDLWIFINPNTGEIIGRIGGE
ncbi:MAG: hypothetical protein WC481_01265 [Candidatus Omnitrophota bacterium]